MSESSDLYREERRIRQFKAHLMDQIAVLRAPYPDRVAVEAALNSLANDVVLIAYYGDKLNYANILLHDVCKDYSDALKTYGFNVSHYPATYRTSVVADDLEEMMIHMPF
jgi:hypothetical protein